MKYFKNQCMHLAPLSPLLKIKARCLYDTEMGNVNVTWIVYDQLLNALDNSIGYVGFLSLFSRAAQITRKEHDN